MRALEEVLAFGRAVDEAVVLVGTAITLEVRHGRGELQAVFGPFDACVTAPTGVAVVDRMSGLLNEHPGDGLGRRTADRGPRR